MGEDDISRRSVLDSLGSGDSDGGHASRRGLLRGVAAGGLAVGGLGLSTGTAAAASRTQLQSATNGAYGVRQGVDMAIYRAQTERTAAVDLFFEKATDMLDQLVAADIIPGWRVRLYDTDRDSVDNNRGEDWGAYDVKRIYEDEGWTDEDLGLWFTEEAKVWNADTETHELQSVRGGSAGYQTAFDPDSRATIAPAWMSTKNSDDRVVAHGASMEMMHAMVDGGLAPVQQCHGGHGEHSLGNAIYEYNGDYGQWGHFGSPIAAGPHTWERGACASGVDEKDGITFTLTPCTKLAVRQTKRDRVADLSMCGANCADPDVPPMAGGCPPADHDGDGLCEDVRGTGDLSMLDVQALFENIQNPKLQEHSEAFNFSGLDPGEVTILDVQALFNRLDE
jgi:hypothetical protein